MGDPTIAQVGENGTASELDWNRGIKDSHDLVRASLWDPLAHNYPPLGTATYKTVLTVCGRRGIFVIKAPWYPDPTARGSCGIAAQERERRRETWAPRWFRAPAGDPPVYPGEYSPAECPMWEWTGAYMEHQRDPAPAAGAPLLLPLDVVCCCPPCSLPWSTSAVLLRRPVPLSC